MDAESDDQKSWKAFARSLRLALDNHIMAQLPSLKPGEIRDLVLAANEALWIGINAECFDEEVEKRKAEFD